ncbi:MAG TPA: LLM class flavin-dependent oxidoreductase [Conexibacter sp.]|jgi:alkanesulfonate monooxygenase SsuD/methylene tetrahydromethanopterin reductase-like flavin-dependent oxidoreductase (luciferase family)
MKLGLVLSSASAQAPLESLSRQAQALEERGLDLAMIEQGGADGPPLLTAAALSARTSTLRIVVAVDAGPHPLEIAELATVVDNECNGRLVLCVNDGRGDAGLLDETAQVLSAALAPRPFRHDGERWTIPANLPENDGQEQLIVVTPPTAQLELPLWLGGTGAAQVARAHGLAHVTSGAVLDVDAADRWAAVEAAVGSARVARLRRPGVFLLDADASGAFDADALVARLLAARAAWGLDVALLRPAPGLDDDALVEVVRRLATWVRPRVIQHTLPAGLVEHWRDWLPAHDQG